MPDVDESAGKSPLGMAPNELQEGNAGDDNNPAVSANATFPRFRDLPAEIQVAIWDMAAASPILTPEYAPTNPGPMLSNFFWVSTGQKMDINLSPGAQILIDLMVLTGWSPLMHTCFDSRAAALGSSSLPLRFSKTARFRVPCCPFDTTIDALYLDQELLGDIYIMDPRNVKVAAEGQFLVLFEDWKMLESYGAFSSLRYSFLEFRDANGCRPERFEPSQVIDTRRRMRLVQIPVPPGDCHVLLGAGVGQANYDFVPGDL